MRSKEEVRAEIWEAMARAGVARFPGARGRIPNFTGARQAAERLASHAAWRRARAIKANPDYAQAHVRRLALEQGKVVVMAVPRLRHERPFRLLDPASLDPRERTDAATIRGAMQLGKPLTADQVPPLDLVLCGSVAVNRAGVRVGKGGGYSDLEFGLLVELGRVGERTVIATTVHSLQLREGELPRLAHDFPVDLIATPDELIEVTRTYARPTGILPDHLDTDTAAAIPALAAHASGR